MEPLKQNKIRNTLYEDENSFYKFMNQNDTDDNKKNEKFNKSKKSLKW